MANKTKKFKNGYTRMNEVNFTMDNIIQQYPGLSVSEIDSFCPVFYPVAIVELKMQEKTFEDFESLQLPILKMVYAGVCNAEIIAKTFCLSENYVIKILHYLQGVGLITDDGMISEIGRESIQIGQRVNIVSSIQKFQIDALSGELIRLDQSVDKKVFVDKKDTDIKTGHLLYREGISLSYIENKIKDDTQKEKYLKKKSRIIHSNVIAINEAKLDELEYAKAYMMKIMDKEEVIVWAKRKNPDWKSVMEGQKRYIWIPFAVTDKSIREKLELTDNVPEYDTEQYRYIKTLEHLMFEAQRNQFGYEDENENRGIRRDIETGVKRLLAIEGEIKIDFGNENKRSSVRIQSGDITKYSDTLIDVLYNVANNLKYVTTSGELYGHMVEIYFEDSIVSLAKQIRRIIDEEGIKIKELKNYIKAEGIETESVIDRLSELLDDNATSQIKENGDFD